MSSLKLLIKVLIIETLLTKSTLNQQIVSTTETPNHNKVDLSDTSSRLERFELRVLELEKWKLEMEKLLKNISASKKNIFPTSCQEVKEAKSSNSGIYFIKPILSPQHFSVFCDMQTKGGGWTYFINRFDGTVDFFLPWNDYKFGFGNLLGEHWLGLEHLHHITSSEINELLVELKDWNEVTVYAHYDLFVIGSENEGYVLKAIEKYSGNAGDGMLGYAGMKFTTKDKDQDTRAGSNCAKDEHGAWWYTSCSYSNPTSRYLKKSTQAGYTYSIMYWNDFRGSGYSLKSLKMMVRPKKL